jgi:exodeoxyribonuclease V beta subunit
MNQSGPALLDALQFPLHGTALIEASAGTGKTFTIAALYLRLVLGHGGAAAFERPLTPPEILVVTFTEAATKELRDRIRARLASAADAFLHQPGTAADDAADALLQSLRASIAPEQWPACAQRLRIAAEWMDEAAVSTIHGWCNRMLREHAFDSGSLFSQELQADQSELQEEAVRDYWRTFFYPLPAQDAAAIAGWWSHPGRLWADLQRLLPFADRLEQPEPPAQTLRAVRADSAEQVARMRDPWASSWCDALHQLLDEAGREKKVDGRKLHERHYGPWIRHLRAWCSGQAEQPLPSDAAWKRLSPAGLRDAWKKADEAPEHEMLRDLETLAARMAALPDGRDLVLAHATRWVAQRLATEQHRRAQMGFNDLLTQLHAALHGPNGDRLAALIRTQFPVALIDEFQDTDPVQYGIFRRIYGSGGPEPTALVLIGDPKQAIYGFRGADIHTYLAARRDTEGRHATLGTNFRSTREMVQAVNHVFAQAEQRAQGQGAFLFRTAAANPLPFFEVGAKGRDQSWRVEGEPAAALTCWWRDEGQPLDDAAYRAVMANACAAEIVRLLQLGQAGQAGFVGQQGELRPVLPQDIAILVNNRGEARAVREALAAANVRSVYLSDQESVFWSPVAGELQRLLQACAAPDDGRMVRAALGTALLALDWQELERLNQDELHWELRLEQFRGYRQRWQRQGVLPMVRRLLHDFGVPQRLIAAGDERQLTDLLHLCELLQQASALVDGEHALVRHLADQRQDAATAADHRQLRLESDADLLKVVTVHKSKGLEYPLVFVPFPCACRVVSADDVPLKWHDAEGGLQVSLRPDADMVAAADRERLGEDLRKLYVALTRARFATWIGVAPTRELQRSAVGYLLAGDAGVAPGTLHELLGRTLGSCDAVRVLPAPELSTQRYVPAAALAPLAPPPRLAQGARDRWWIASYSRLRLLANADETLPVPAEAGTETAAEETYLESVADERGLDGASVAAPGSLHDFPRGAAPGIFLHGLLEWAGRRGFAAVAAAPREAQEMLARRTLPQAWLPQRQALADWLLRWLDTPLRLERLTPDATPVAPRELGAVQVEMEFWLGATEVDARRLDALVCAHTLEGVPRSRLQPQQLNGMLKGFMDLVFEHEGRYYVADYKSNWLGPDDAAYTLAAMRDEVLHHRYELQYCLYLFALHRLLRARLPDYDYDQHVGGAVYVFLRGHAASTQGLHLERPPRELMDAMDLLFSGAEVRT